MKKIVKILLFVPLICIVFCIIYIIISPTVVLSPQRDSIITVPLTKELRYKINCETRGMYRSDIMDYSVKLTAQYLRCSEHDNIEQGEATSAGYASLCSSIFNYACYINGEEARANPVIGRVKPSGYNLAFITLKSDKWKPLVKNHEFVRIDGDFSAVWYVDPYAYDLIGSDCFTYDWWM